MVKYRIIFPDESKVTSEIEEEKIKINSMLKKTNNGILSRILVFLNQYGPCSTTELTSLLTSFYKTPYDRANITKYLQVLMSINLISRHEAFYAMAHGSNGDEVLRVIKEKHEEFLRGIPPQFHKQFDSVNYYFINDYGKTFLPWSCKVIGFKCEEE